MHTFFHGWRRKAGCVALAMALMSMGLWLRSHWIAERLSNDFGGHVKYWEALLLDGNIIIQHRYFDYSKFDGRISFLFPRGIAFEQLSHEIAKRDRPSQDWHRQGCLGLEWSHRQGDEGGGISFSITEWNASMLWVIIPLTLLSAYLILWKPRKKA